MGDVYFKHDSLAVVRPFSVGTRNCIVENLARTEMRVILAKLLFCFDVGRGRSGRRDGWSRGLLCFRRIGRCG